jgi:YVTN family beta-propeller protein
LLFNGWGVTPAGEHVPISDLALKLVVSPDKKMLLAASAGFNDTGLSLLDIASRRVTQFLPLARIWNGLAFSLDGRRILVSGGDSGRVHVFKYADAKATPAESVKPSPNGGTVFLAGMAVHPATGKVYVCNEANDEIWVLNAQTLALETTVAVGEFPHSCIFGADKRHLYVSNWGSRSVSAVDTQQNRRVRNIPVGIRPNDLALAPDGHRACDPNPNRGKASAGSQPQAPRAGGGAGDHLHLALSRVARGQHVRRRGGVAGRQDALRGQRR